MSKLTSEQIEIITKLQPFFKEKMGERRLEDEVLYGNMNGIIDSIS